MLETILSTQVLHGFAGVLIGGTLGFLYYRIIGCSSGTCPITANKWSSIIYGAVLGLTFSLS